MNPTPRTTATVTLVCAMAVQGALLTASADSVEWHIVADHSPVTGFALNPAEPTTTNVISFIAPTDGKVYVNGCNASVLNGDPAITVDSTNQTVTVSFSPPVTNIACPLVVIPVSGVDGQFGPLKSGTWVLEILQNSYTFKVAEVPLLLSLQTLTNPSSFQLRWPVSGDTFVLEFNDSLSSLNWQAVTNAPVTSSNQNVVQIDSASGNQFFRLRRQSP